MHYLKLTAALLALMPALPLAGQTGLPAYLKETIPAPGATQVPTNTRLLLRGNSNFSAFYSTVTLRSEGGTVVELRAESANQDGLWTPATPLSPSTTYTVRIQPPAWSGASYDFTFRTGLGPLAGGPQVAEFDPPAGARGVSLGGPYRVRFDRPVIETAVRAWTDAIQVTDSFGTRRFMNTTLAADGRSVVLRLSSPDEPMVLHRITVDPTKLLGEFAIPGEGAMAEATLWTVVAPDGAPERIAAYPDEGDVDVPTNVRLQILYERPLRNEGLANGGSIRCGDSVIPFEAQFLGDARLLSLRTTQLLPAAAHCRWSVGMGLFDDLGVPVETFTAEFKTAAGPDLGAGILLQGSPSADSLRAPAPANAWPRARYSKRIHPVAAARLTQIQGTVDHSWASNVDARPELFAGGTGVLVRPLRPLENHRRHQVLVPGSYPPMWDLTGAELPVPSWPFRVTDEEDHDAPSVVSSVPAAGAEGVQADTTLVVVFSEPMGAALRRDPVELLLDGNPVRNTVTWAGHVLSVKPELPLMPGASYALALRGLADTAGNSLPETVLPFSVAQSAAPAPAFTAVERIPAAQATGVDPGAEIRVKMSLDVAAVDPGSLLEFGQTIDSPRLAFRTVIEGDTVRVIPLERLPADHSIRMSLRVVDARGRTEVVFWTFRTAAAQAGEFEIESVTPPPGSFRTQNPFRVEIRFSDRVNPATVTAETLFVFDGQLQRPVNPVFSPDFRRVWLMVNADAPVTLFASGGIRSLHGATLKPLRIEYSPAVPLSGTLLSWTPENPRPSNSVGDRLGPDDPFTLFSTTVFDEDEARRFGVVTVNGEGWPGEFTVGAMGHALTFWPARSYPDGAQVRLYWRWPDRRPWPLASFSTRSVPDFPEILTSADSAASMPTGMVIDFEFPEPVPAHQPNIIFERLDEDLTTSISYRVEQIRPRTLRLTPESPLTPGRHSVSVRIFHGSGRWLTSGALLKVREASENWPRPVRVAPQNGSTDVPITAIPSVLFSVPVNRLTVSRANVRLFADDCPVPFQLRFQDVRGFYIIPLTPLDADTDHHVVIEGFEDITGRTIEPLRWSFRTGAWLDYRQPVWISPSNWLGTQFAPGATATVVASEPMDPITASLGNPGLHIEWDGVVSEDLRSVVYNVPGANERGAQATLSLPRVRDLSGIPTDFRNLTFRTGIVDDTEPPRLLNTYPEQDMSGVPVNAQILLRFDELVDSSTLARVELWRAEERVPLQLRSLFQELAVFQPQRPFEPGETYRLVVEGIADGWGNVMEERREVRFEAGPALVTGYASCRWAGTSTLPANAPIRLEFSRPMTTAGVAQGFRLFSHPAANSSLSFPVPASVEMAADRLSAVLVPGTPLEPGGAYRVTLGGHLDPAGNSCSIGSTSWRFTVTPPDYDPPVVTVTPPDGATVVPRNARLGVLADKIVEPVDGQSLTLECNGADVALRQEQSTAPPQFSPIALLPRAGACVLRIPAYVDVVGNRSEPFESRFTVADAISGDVSAPQVTATKPESGAAGVDPTAPVTLTFNKALRPVIALPPEVTFSAGGVRWPYMGRVGVSGSDLALTPAPSLPGAAQITVQVEPRFHLILGGITDLAGNRITRAHTTTFATAALPDTDPPRVEDVHPEEGLDLRPNPTRFTIQLSEPVVLRPGAVVLLAGSQPITGSIVLSADARQILIAPDYLPPESVITLFLSDGVTDLAGNPLAPRQMTWRTLEAEGPGVTAVAKVTPSDGAVVSSGDAAVVLEFNRPMSVAPTEAAVRVLENDEWMGGAATLEANRRVLRFQPDRPFQPGSRVFVFVLESAMDADGIPLGFPFRSRFTVAAESSGAESPLEVTRTSAVLDAGTARPALDVEFSRPLAPASVHEGTVWVRVGQRRVSGVVSLVDGRVIRFVSDEPLPDAGPLILTAGLGLTAEDGTLYTGRDFAFAAPESTGEPELRDVEMTADGAIRVRFRAPVSATARFGFRLSGATGPSRRYQWFETGDRSEWLLVPLEGDAKEPLRLEYRGRTVWHERRSVKE